MELDPNRVINLVMLLVTTFGGIISKALYSYLQSRTKSEDSKRLLSVVWDAVDGSVRRVSQELVPQVKAAAADGKISAEERSNLAKSALHHARSSLSGSHLDEIKAHFNLNTENELTEWLTTKMEHSVHNMRSNEIAREG